MEHLHKWKWIIGLWLCLIILIAGCSSSTRISTPESRLLSKQLKEQFKGIKKVECVLFTINIEWILTWKEPPTEEESTAVFSLIQDYVMTENFVQDVAYTYNKNNANGSAEYPIVNIIYDMNNDNNYDRKFTSTFNTKSQSYQDWYYSDDYVSVLVKLE